MGKQLDTPASEAVATCPFDHHSPALSGEAKYAAYEELRQRRVQRTDAHGGYWVLSRAQDVRAALMDTDAFSSQRGGVFVPPPPTDNVFAALEHDPPDHGPFRRLFAKAVNRAALESARQAIEAMAERVVGQFAAAGGGDFVAQVGSVLPVETIALVIGLPPDKATRLRELTQQVWANLATDPNAFGPLIGMYMGEIMERRAQPRDDFLSLLANTEMIGDRPMTDDDVIGIINGLLIAGHETTMNASAILALHLAREPALRGRVVSDPTVIPAVVEESLRLDSPVQNFFRTLTRDVEVDGVVMHEGDRVGLIYGSANRDPQAFADPDAFDPDRPDLAHYSFGLGIHRCVGAPLALLELRLLCSLLAPLDFWVVGEPEFAPPSGGGPFSGLAHLPLAFT